MSDNSEAFEDRKSEMLEDEEMPTFVSVSSKDISLPYSTDGNIQLMPIDNSSNPLGNTDEITGGVYEPQSRSHTTEEREDEGNNDNEEGSVYVLSSGDDGAYPDSSSRSNFEEVDDEEEEDEDDEEVEDEEDVNDMHGVDLEEKGIDMAEEADDFSEEEIEHDAVMSDDMALRSTKPKPVNQRKRSQSMQDLSGFCQFPSTRMVYVTGGNQYNRVQSKVKRYIQDLKDMNKRSMERRKSTEEAIKLNERKAKVDRDEEVDENNRKSTGRRSIKDYAEQALKDLEMRDEVSQETENVPTQEYGDGVSARRNNCLQVDKQALPKTENHEHRQNDLDSEESNGENDTGKLKKVNMNGELLKDGLKNVKIQKSVNLHFALNGQAQGQNIMDVRSIGYDEYMRGGSNSSVEKNPVALETRGKLSRSEMNSAKLEAKNSQSEAPSKIAVEPAEGTEEILMEVAEQQESPKPVIETESKKQNNSEALAKVALIQSQLNQKTTQCKEIREAYEKTLTENFELKQELEDLKKTLSKLSAKKSSPQLVTVAIQTDPTPSSDEPKDIPAADTAISNPKLSTSSMGSAFSYNDRWAESVGSLPTSNGSTRPMPNLTPLSNAEDSFIGMPSTPLRTPRQPSHTFQTSSRIIKMLSSITQRGSKVDSGVIGEESSANVHGKTVNSPGVSSFNSPINHRSSNKRKASELPENSSFLQPPKIAHTAGGSHRFHKRTKSEFKYPGDYVKPNSETFAPQSSDANRSQDNFEDSRREDDAGEDADSRVKCFTYRDDDNSLERSFLIQAEEEEKGQEGVRDGERTSIGVVRECGPYLLGNVEVRMTEINGTINIWGKEVSRETNAEDEPEEEANVDNELNESVTCGCGLQTPKPRHNSNGPISCSTNKKAKIPSLRLTDFGCSKNHNSPSASGPRATISAVDNIRERLQLRNSPNLEAEGYCRNFEAHSGSCNANKSKIFQNFEEEEHVKNIPKNSCSCNWEREKVQYSSCPRVCRHCRGEHDCASNTPNPPHTSGKCSRLNSVQDNEQSKTEENLSRNNFLCLNTDFGEENLFSQHGGARKNRAFEDDDEEDVFKKPSTSNPRVNENFCKNESCRSHSSSFNNQSTGPLLSHHSHEPPEVRRRRLSGKRVRGILMDLLKGCGDCRTTTGPDNKVSPTILSQVRVRSGSPPPSLSTPIQQRTANYGSTNDRCVHAECCKICAQKLEVAADFEAQLKIFEAEMERLRSRSRAVLGMLNTLHSADIN